MKVNLSLEDWNYKVNESGRIIQGNFLIKAGTTQIAKQAFNRDYGDCAKVLFSAALMADIEEITERIEQEIRETFIGKEEE